MKVCVSLRSHAPSNLRSDNLRSEARWERQALEACLQNPEVSAVYTVGSWDGSHPKYRGQLGGGDATSTILLLQDWDKSVATRFKYKAVITNIFAGPWLNQIDEVKRTHSSLGGHLYFTMGFPVMHRQEIVENNPLGGQSHLEKFLPRENVLLLPVPGAPYISSSSNFDSKSLIWGQRLVFMNQLEQSKNILWALQQLERDPDLTFDIFTGWFSEEVKDWVNEQVVYRRNISEAFWKLPPFAPLKSVSNRVHIHLDLSWDTILSKYSQAKILTTHGRLFGGPPIEAGMHGVPFIGTGLTGALCDCPDYLYVGSEEDCWPILDRLMSDREYYDHIGDSYRRYTAETYSYDAFNRNLNKILSDRSLL